MFKKRYLVSYYLPIDNTRNCVGSMDITTTRFSKTNQREIIETIRKVLENEDNGLENKDIGKIIITSLGRY